LKIAVEAVAGGMLGKEKSTFKTSGTGMTKWKQSEWQTGLLITVRPTSIEIHCLGH